MKNYVYKCVPVPSTITISKKGHTGQVIAEYQNIINKVATEGWELDRVDSITSHQPAGCLGGLLGNPGKTLSHKILIFRKEA